MARIFCPNATSMRWMRVRGEGPSRLPSERVSGASSLASASLTSGVTSASTSNSAS